MLSHLSFICCTFSHMHLPFWTTILKLTVLHLRQLDSAHAPTACTAFMYISTNCLSMNSKLCDNHAHPHILAHTCMLLPVGYSTWSLLTTSIQCSGVPPGLVSSIVVCTLGGASGCDGQVSTAHDLVIAVIYASAAPPQALPLPAS